MQAIPSGGRPSASVRALHTATTRSWRSGARSATGISRGAGASIGVATVRSTATGAAVISASGSHQTESTVSAAITASRRLDAWSR